MYSLNNYSDWNLQYKSSDVINYRFAAFIILFYNIYEENSNLLHLFNYFCTLIFQTDSKMCFHVLRMIRSQVELNYDVNK